jgi:hypothetical protein
MADSGYKNISRIDAAQKNTHGWYVRIQFKGKSYARFFNDAYCGGSQEALQEAVEYRNQLEVEIGRERTERYLIGGLHPRNNTGVAGVTRTQRVEKKRGKKYIREVYEVTWNPEPGRVRRTTVSVKKYGEEEAFRRACAIRKAKEAKIYRATREPDTT